MRGMLGGGCGIRGVVSVIKKELFVLKDRALFIFIVRKMCKIMTKKQKKCVKVVL